MIKEGWVYFILAAGRELRSESYVKIGWTGTCPWSRMNNIDTSSPLPLRLIALVPGSQKVERDYHKVFAELRHHNEWFRWETSLIEFVNRYPDPDRVEFHRTVARGVYSAGCPECHQIYIASRPKRRSLS